MPQSPVETLDHFQRLLKELTEQSKSLIRTSLIGASLEDIFGRHDMVIISRMMVEDAEVGKRAEWGLSCQKEGGKTAHLIREDLLDLLAEAQDAELTRRCRKCRKICKLFEFSKLERGYLGRNNVCKRCERERVRQYAEKRKKPPESN